MVDEGLGDGGAREEPAGGRGDLVASIERGMPFLLPGWAVALFLFLVFATEPLGLDEGAASAAPLVFLLASSTAILLLTALGLAVRQAVRAVGLVRIAWVAAALALLMASLVGLANLTVDTGDYEGQGCARWALLPAGSFGWLRWIPWPAWAALGVGLGALAPFLMVLRRTRVPGTWLGGAFLLLFLASLGALDGCPDL